MKRKLLNLAMLVVVVALAVGVYFASREKPVPVQPPLTALNTATISRIEVDRPGKPTIRLEKKDGGWRFASPIEARADGDNVASILAVASSPCQQRIDDPQVKPSDLGLDPPKYSILFDKTRVDVGMVEPLKYRRYVETGGHVCLVSDPSAPGLGSEDYANLVSRRLLPPGEKLDGIVLPGYTLKLGADGKTWSLDPADPKAVDDAAQQLADAWSSARSMWNKLIPANSKPPQDAKTVTLRFKDGSHLEFLVSARTPQLQLQRRDLGIEYVLSESDAGRLLALENKPATKKDESGPAPVAPSSSPSPANASPAQPAEKTAK